MKQKGINLATTDFEQEITEKINNCGLPASTIRLVMTRVLDEIVRIENNLIEQERKEYEKEDDKDEIP